MKTLKQWIDFYGPAEVARRLGLSTPLVSQVGRGTRRPSAEMLARAEALWGKDLDLRGTLRESRPGAAERTPGAP